MKHAVMPTETFAKPRYLTAAEAAAYLRISPRTLEKHRIVGGGPRYRKVGRMVRYTIKDLDAWTESRSFAMTADPEYPYLPGSRRRKKA